MKPGSKEFLFYLFINIFILAGCSPGNGNRWHIGVSQCVGGKWREKVNQEMLTAQHLYNKEVKIDITDAENDSRRQVRQIDSLVASGVDLLIVAPNSYEEISPAIDRAYKSGIPVILFDRKAQGSEYTAYIGGDNVEAGRAMGHYALSLIRESSYDHRPRILEITGGTVSSPARDRHQGFSTVMQHEKSVDYSFVNTDWSDKEVYNAMYKWLKTHHKPDIVFCHSDIAAFSARRAATDLHLDSGIRFLGVDGLPGPDGGMEAVEKGILAGTYVYPSHGEQIIKLALDILQKKPYRKTTIMNSVIVTPDNAPILLQSSMETLKQTQDLLVLQNKLEDYFGLYHTQRTVSIVAIVAIVLLVLALVLIWRAVVQLRKASRKMKKMNEDQTLFYTNARHQLRTPLTLIEGPLKKLSASKTMKGDDRQLVEILQRNVSQLSSIVYGVLNFSNNNTHAVGDGSAITAEEQAAVTAAVQKGRLEMLKKDGSSLPRVLIVDDNDDMRSYLKSILSDQYDVVEAADGESGLKLAREIVPDLIVSDVMMPVMDGLTFCKKIKENGITSHVPVILLTARSTDEQQKEGLDSGADAYMTKPFNSELLLARISNLLESRRKLRKLFNGQSADLDSETMMKSDKKFINTLKQTILKRMGDSNLKMDDLGAELGMSRVQLYRKVKALTGMSPVELLREMRLQRAYKLLETTDRTVSQVAYDVGFGTPGYFSSCFKKQFGKYPTEMKKE